ncbi:hypothetical protein CEXT_777201 [Caerostris extrusa]|uniref:Uncharacterized protein n=1 Tax=Caerostris extrusa TaxID=172846 RepID=A0AAV4V5U1_CAEEX|nr:hypothetical protein CEXT_777201 [Caerostris extrusa]
MEPVTKNKLLLLLLLKLRKRRLPKPKSPEPKVQKLEIEETTKGTTIVSVDTEIKEALTTAEFKTETSPSIEAKTLSTTEQISEAETKELVSKDQITTASSFETSDELFTETKAFKSESPITEFEKCKKQKFQKLKRNLQRKKVTFTSIGVQSTEKISPISEEKLQKNNRKKLKHLELRVQKWKLIAQQKKSPCSRYHRKTVSEEKTGSTSSDEIEKFTTIKQTDEPEIKEIASKEQIATTPVFETSELSIETKTLGTESPKLEDESTTRKESVPTDGAEIVEKMTTFSEEITATEAEKLFTKNPTDETEIKEAEQTTMSSTTEVTQDVFIEAKTTGTRNKITEKSTEFLSTSTSSISEEGKETKLEEKHTQTTSILLPVTDASTHKKLFEDSTPSSFTSEAETSTFKKTTVTESPDFETTTVSTDFSPKTATSTLSSEEDIKTGTPKTTLGTASSTFEATETEIITSKSDDEVSISLGIKLDKTTTLSSQDKFTTLKDEIKETTASLLPEKFTGVTDATTVKESEFSDTTTLKHTQESSVTDTEISPKTDIIESETTSIAPKTSSHLDITTEAITKVTTLVTTDTSEKELKETELVESVKTTDKFTTEEALITGSEESAVTQTKVTDFDERHLTTKEIQEPKIELTTTGIVKTDAETTAQHFTPIPEIKISSTRKEFEEKKL